MPIIPPINPFPPPSIDISLTPQVIFEDENATLSWDIANATCATLSYQEEAHFLLPDLTQISGTKADGGSYGSGGSAKCDLERVDSWTFEGSGYRQSHITFYFDASSYLWIIRRTVERHRTTWLDILSVPTFKGNATPERVSQIRDAIKTIDTTLRNGTCFGNNPDLNATIPVFANKQIDQAQLAAQLLIALQNMKLITFSVTDAAVANGHWHEYTNEIQIDWAPGIYLEYIIFHELLHKYAFNSQLFTYGYSVADIEGMGHAIAGTCFPL
jgi:hypothetical protein